VHIIKENKQQKMEVFKSEMDELKRTILASHQQIEKEFNEKLKKMIEDQQQQQPSSTMASVPIPDNPKMANLDQQVHHLSERHILCLNNQILLGHKN
jgi:uncharacterized membrane-anchored protein YhcB (DUF1043 family)